MEKQKKKRNMERMPTADYKRFLYLIKYDQEAYARELHLINTLGLYKGYIFPKPKL